MSDGRWMCRVTCHVAPPNTGDGCTFPICRCEEAKTAPTPFDAALISAAEEIVGRHMVVKLIKYQSGVAGLYREIESMGKIIDKRDAYLDELAKS